MNKGHNNNANIKKKRGNRSKENKEQKRGQEKERERIKNETAFHSESSDHKCENKKKDVTKKPESLEVTEKEVIETIDTKDHDLLSEDSKGKLLEDEEKAGDINNIEDKLKNMVITPNEENNTKLKKDDSKKSSKIIDVFKSSDAENDPCYQIKENMVNSEISSRLELEKVEGQIESVIKDNKHSKVPRSLESKNKKNPESDGSSGVYVQETKKDIESPESKIVQNDLSTNEEDIKINARTNSENQIVLAVLDSKSSNDTILETSGESEIPNDTEKSKDNRIIDLNDIVYTNEESNSSKYLDSLNENKGDQNRKEEITTEKNQQENQTIIKVADSKVSSSINLKPHLTVDDEYDCMMRKFREWFNILVTLQDPKYKGVQNTSRDQFVEYLRTLIKPLIIEAVQNFIPSSQHNAETLDKEPLQSVGDKARNIKESNDTLNNEKESKDQTEGDTNNQIQNMDKINYKLHNEEKTNQVDVVEVTVQCCNEEEINNQLKKVQELNDKLHKAKDPYDQHENEKEASDHLQKAIELQVKLELEENKLQLSDIPDFESTRIETPARVERDEEILAMELTGIHEEMSQVSEQQNGVEQCSKEEIKEVVQPNDQVIEDNDSNPKTNASLDLGTTLDSTEGGEKEPSQESLRFHSVHGDNIRLTNNNFRAQRKKKSNFFSKGIAFSSRPVAIGEKVSLHLKQLSSYWLGLITIGFTTNDPNSIAGNLPANVIIERDCGDGFWVEHLDKKYFQESCRLNYYLNSSGNMCFGVNGKDKIEFLWNLQTTKPVWALIDVFGYFTTVEFDIPKELGNKIVVEKSSLLSDRNESCESWTQSGADNVACLNYQIRFMPLDLYTQFEGNCMRFSEERGVCISSGDKGGCINSKFPLFPGQTIVIQYLTAGKALLCVGVKYGYQRSDKTIKLSEAASTVVIMRNKDELALTFTDSGEIQVAENLDKPETIFEGSPSNELWPYFMLFKPNQMIKIWSSNTPNLDLPLAIFQS